MANKQKSEMLDVAMAGSPVCVPCYTGRHKDCEDAARAQIEAGECPGGDHCTNFPFLRWYNARLGLGSKENSWERWLDETVGPRCQCTNEVCHPTPKLKDKLVTALADAMSNGK